jgi:hypothetical protein
VSVCCKTRKRLRSRHQRPSGSFAGRAFLFFRKLPPGDRERRHATGRRPASFWLQEVAPVYWVWQKLLFVLGGLMLPLQVYPAFYPETRWVHAIPIAARCAGVVHAYVAFSDLGILKIVSRRSRRSSSAYGRSRLASIRRPT